VAIGERYLAALCAADAPTAEAVVAEALVAGVAPTTIQVRVIGAAMERIGELWEQGEVTVADEHVATVLSYRALLPLQELLQIAPPRSRERVVLAAVEGQAHVLGLRMVADVLEGAGFEVLYLGADDPQRGSRWRHGRAHRRRRVHRPFATVHAGRGRPCRRADPHGRRRWCLGPASAPPCPLPYEQDAERGAQQHGGDDVGRG
jgi:hypothetical protein